MGSAAGAPSSIAQPRGCTPKTPFLGGVDPAVPSASSVRCVLLQDQALHIPEGMRDGSDPSKTLGSGTGSIPRFILCEPAAGASCQGGRAERRQTLRLLKVVERQGEPALG